jgi:hypothetical protein
MPWFTKAPLAVLKTKRGRKLLLAGMRAVEIACSEQERELYAKVWRVQWRRASCRAVVARANGGGQSQTESIRLPSSNRKTSDARPDKWGGDVMVTADR